MYIPNKPNKYGLKIMCCTDARTGYFYNGYIYTGKDSYGKIYRMKIKNLANQLKVFFALHNQYIIQIEMRRYIIRSHP